MSPKQETSPSLSCHPAQQDWEERNGLVIFLYTNRFIEEGCQNAFFSSAPKKLIMTPSSCPRSLRLLLEQMGDELIQATAPGEPLVTCALRFIEIDLDAGLAEIVGKGSRTEVLVCTTAEE